MLVGHRCHSHLLICNFATIAKTVFAIQIYLSVDEIVAIKLDNLIRVDECLMNRTQTRSLVRPVRGLIVAKKTGH